MFESQVISFMTTGGAIFGGVFDALAKPVGYLTLLGLASFALSRIRPHWIQGGIALVFLILFGLWIWADDQAIHHPRWADDQATHHPPDDQATASSKLGPLENQLLDTVMLDVLLDQLNQLDPLDQLDPQLTSQQQQDLQRLLGAKSCLVKLRTL